MFFRVSLLFFTLVFTSCSSVTLTGKGKLDVNISSIKSLKKKKVISDEIYEFLLWGNIPLNHNIELGDELAKLYIGRVGNLTVEHYQNRWDNLLTYLSLGLYSRHRVRVTGWGDIIEYK